MPLLEKELEVKTSTVAGAGHGLFTKTFIYKGTRIVEYKGTIVTWEEVKNDSTNPYIYFLNHNYVIDGRNHPKSLGRYTNDAKGLNRVKNKSNNSEFVNDGLRAFLVATKNIQPGEEIFTDYGRMYWDTVRKNLSIDKIK